MARLPLLLAVGALALIGCTRTVYVVDDGHGNLREIDPPDDPADPDEPDLVAVPDDDDLVIVDVATESDYVLVDDDATVYVLVDVTGRDDAPVERAPVTVALVVDRSGSMEGPKMDAARAAAASLVDELEDGDAVTLVSYASDATLEVPLTRLDRRGRATLLRAIERLTAVGGTDLGGGLALGASEVVRGHRPSDLARVILISDGRPTVGESDPNALVDLADRWFDEGVSVTTMGVGYDYNEDLMTSLAVYGGGNYYYVEDPRDMVSTLDREVRGIGHTVARDVTLSLALAPGVEVREVFGYRHEQRGREVRVPMSALAAGATRRVLVALSVPPRERGAAPLFDAQVAYRGPDERARRVDLPGKKVSFTRDPRLVARTERRPVVEKVERVRNAVLREQVMARLDRGDRAAAEALVARRLEESRRASARVGGAVLAKEADEVEALSDKVRAAPAPATDAYRHLRKSEKARAFDALMY